MNMLKTGDLQLEYWDEGDGLPIVFIHGVATAGDLWVADLADLARDARLIVYNRRGYGRSSASPRDWREHAPDVIQLVEMLSAYPAMLIGYSGGAMIALDVVLRRPDLVSKLILLDPAFNLKRCLTLGLLRTLATVRWLRRLGRDRRAAECWLRYVSSYSTGGSAFESKASATRRAQLLANAPGVFADLDSSGGSIDEDRLRDVTAPVTIIDGKLSPSFLRRSAERLKHLLPQARAISVEKSGHWLALDARAELLDVLRAELARLHPTSAARDPRLSAG
jgi:pimeloyl-ACP methyl ester carboxylesterase